MDRLRYFGFLLKDISRLHSKNFERHSVALNLTLAQCRVLPHLQRDEGVSQVRLAELADTEGLVLLRVVRCLPPAAGLSAYASAQRAGILQPLTIPVLHETLI